ncbi:hypothetical protein GCM10009037_27940 [Halarchaeum grantii]|uniref:Uncharacterized protein n=1 Tax=Halarchaeum grantii TaxID=1193105 RepID=A0A830EYM2_9EURY|nr:hypothetical protein [Halarchaeum grantii]GGL42807.1 hypothetical protein GCM10009037_27940 [Halarchaeum grantii]
MDVEHVNLVKPNGSLFGKRGVAKGASRVSFDVGTTYTPGEYTLVAVNGDQTVGTTTQSLRPDLQILEMGIGRNQPAKMWDGTEHRTGVEAFVSVANRGSGPTAITKLLFMGFVPYPSGENGTSYADQTDVSGIYNPESDSEVQDVVIPPGTQTTIYSYRAPFAFGPGANVTCTDQQQEGTFRLILETGSREGNVSQTYSIHYSASEQLHNCSITIGEN